jgi:PEP-CTERM motif
MTTTFNSSRLLGVLAIALAASSAQAMVIDQTNIGVGTSGTDGAGFMSFASGVMDTSVAGPYTGVGVAGGSTNGEIDVGESITLTFDTPEIVASFRIGLLYNGPEYGDVKEVARITADNAVYTLRATPFDGEAFWFDSSGNYLSSVFYEYDTTPGAGAVINMINPFGSTMISSLTFEAVPGTCWSGTCTNESDYNLINVSTVTPVPEPSTYALMLAGLGAIGWITRRRRQQ